jgi:hypothetical protein
MIDNPMGQAAVAYHLAQLHLEAEERKIARAMRAAERPSPAREVRPRRRSRVTVVGFFVRLATMVTRRSDSTPAQG